MCSVGSRGDSYDNALAEAVNGLYKAELIRKDGPWRSLEQVELATAEWVDWSRYAGDPAGSVVLCWRSMSGYRAP